METDKKQHESYGMISISRFSSNGSQFFGSDLTHKGGISLTISKGEKSRKLSSEWYYGGDELIRIELSNSQFIDAIISGMNTQGVPCTITSFDGKRVEQIEHVENKKEQFSSEMKDTQLEYRKRIDDILEMLEGNVGKRKQSDIKHELEVLKSHISSNSNFVMRSFNEAMEKTVTEAKHSISNYIDHKVHSLGIEKLRDQLSLGVGNSEIKTSIE